MNRLLLPPGVLERLRNSLLTSDLETAAILYAHSVKTTSGFRLLFRDFLPAPAEAYVRREHDFIELSPNFIAFALKRARANRASVLLTHTHPWDGEVSASPLDLEGERVLMPTVFKRVPDLPHGRLILGRDDYDAALFLEPNVGESTVRVIELGAYLRELQRLRAAPTHSDADRFDRQMRMFGTDGQTQLARVTVGVVGLGGTGSVVAQELAHLGVRDFVLIDPDTLEESNLNRVVGSKPSDLGRTKTEVAARNIRQINPRARVATLVDSAIINNTAKHLIDCDFFFICTDSHGSRAVLNQLAYQYYVPAIDVGIRIGPDKESGTSIVGRVQMIGPGLSCLVCANLLDTELVRRDLMTDFERRIDPYIVGSPEPQPSVISINSTMSSLAVSMFLSAITGIPMKSRYSLYIGEKGTVRSITVEALPECIICSPSGAAGRGDEWELPGRNS